MSASHAARRLAWRELRRRKGRSALVVALVALPVLALVVGASIARTAQVPDDLRVRAAFGAAGASVHYPAPSSYTPRPERAVPADEAASTVRRVVPGAHVVALEDADGTITDPHGDPVHVRLVSGPTADPLVAPRYVVDGRLPEADGELALSPDLAARLDTGIGQQLSIPGLELTGRVVGLAHTIGQPQASDVLLPRTPAIDPAQIGTELLIDVPPDLDQGTLQAFADTPFNNSAYDVAQFRPDLAARLWPNERPCASRGRYGCGGYPEDLDRAVLVSLLGEAGAFAVLGIVISVAFTLGARRQLRTLGLVAANGGPPRVLRSIVRWQGIWAGVVGAAVGVTGALGLLAALWPLHDRWTGYNPPFWAVNPLDVLGAVIIAILAATGSSHLPARSASRISVLQALAGRSPTRPARPRLAAAGAGLAVAGVLCLSISAVLIARGWAWRHVGDPTFRAIAAGGIYGLGVIGTVALLASSILLAQYLVGAVGRMGGRVGGVPRLSLRSLARQRARFGSVVAAVAASGALACALATTVTASTSPARNVPLPASAAIVRATKGQSSFDTAVPSPEQATAVEAILGSVRHVDLQELEVVEAVGNGNGNSLRAAAATPELIDTWQLDADQRRALDTTGAISIGDRPPARVHLYDRGAIGPAIDVTPFPGTPAGSSLLRDGLPTTLPRVLLAPKALASHGIDLPDPDRRLYLATDTITKDEWQRLTNLGRDVNALRLARLGPPPAALIIDVPTTEPGDVRLAVQVGAAAGATAFAALVLAIGLALAAADSRDERDVLDALGAPPRLQRRVAGMKAATLTLLGALIALPTGILPVVAVSLAIRGADVTDDVSLLARIPWPTIVGLVLIAPVVMGLGTMTGAGVRNRFRPVAASRFADD